MERIMSTRRQTGFTVIEIVIAIAVMALLAGTIAPFAGSALELSRLERATREVEAIGRAVSHFHASVGEWPARNRVGNVAVTKLVSGEALPSANPWRNTGAFDAEFAAGTIDTIVNQLRANTPQGVAAEAWDTTGTTSPWIGPYLMHAPLDPWGRPYLVTVRSGWSSDTVADRGIWVLSAGPDGCVQTTAYDYNARPVGDDIGWLVRMRHP
jgi:prepilin-type N-terminal cleavage/methylation domain-containing protein